MLHGFQSSWKRLWLRAHYVFVTFEPHREPVGVRRRTGFEPLRGAVNHDDLRNRKVDTEREKIGCLLMQRRLWEL